MKVRDVGTPVLIALAVFVGGYFTGTTVTSKSIEKRQDRIVTEYKIVRGYALSLKEKYVKAREQCRSDANWKDTTKCQAIKEVNPKAVKLWNRLVALHKKLKKANSKVDTIQDHIEDINRMKRIALKVAEAL